MSPDPLMNSRENGKPFPLDRSFTWQELSQYNTRDAAYVAIRGKVYDVTDFIPHHPGGEDTLLLAAGRDATLLFESYHPFAISQRLKKYEIGFLTSNELPVFPEPSKFFIALKTRVNDYFVKTKQDPKNNLAIWIRYGVIWGSFLLSYYLQFFNATVRDSLFLQIFTAMVLGFIAAEMGEHQLHDGSHFSLTHSPLVWKMMSSTHDFLNGAGHLTWMYQHVLGHHPYTNIDEADPDVKTGDPDIRRIKPAQSWYIHYAQQHITAPILYAFLAWKTRLQDFVVLFYLKSNVNIRVNPISTKDLTIFWCGKAFFVTYRILIPLLFSQYSLGKILLFLCIADVVLSYWLALVFQVSHIVEEVDWPMPNEKNFIDIDWAAMQVVTTQDYAHDSAFWTAITGALNFQAIHHLFPGVHQYYYPKIGKIVRDTCAEFGYPFLYKETFLDALASHFGHLKNLGRNPIKKVD